MRPVQKKLEGGTGSPYQSVATPTYPIPNI